MLCCIVFDTFYSFQHQKSIFMPSLSSWVTDVNVRLLIIKLDYFCWMLKVDVFEQKNRRWWHYLYRVLTIDNKSTGRWTGWVACKSKHECGLLLSPVQLIRHLVTVQSDNCNLEEVCHHPILLMPTVCCYNGWNNVYLQPRR